MFWILSLFRSCPYCGVTVEPVFGLCKACTMVLWRGSVPREIRGERRGGVFPIYRLLEWKPGDRSPVRGLMHSLKGGIQPVMFDRLAEKFCARYLEKVGGHKRGYLFIPAPPRREGDKDHAYQWGLALARVFSGELVPVLSRRSSRSQKRLSRSGRQGVELELHTLSWKIIQSYNRGMKIVFVDDVVTTGSTATAAYRSLGRLDNFEVWAVAERTSLL